MTLVIFMRILMYFTKKLFMTIKRNLKSLVEIDRFNDCESRFSIKSHSSCTVADC